MHTARAAHLEKLGLTLSDQRPRGDPWADTSSRHRNASLNPVAGPATEKTLGQRDSTVLAPGAV